VSGVQVPPPLPTLSKMIGRVGHSRQSRRDWHASITTTYYVYGHLFHDPAKDVDLLGEMERC
ncbi:MAG: hypothetical protein ABJN35_04205, partial [Erythrobacter sp.]